MRVLLISYYFPPYNSIGSVRVGKFARYLTEMGHSVSVVAARSPAVEQLDASLPVEIDTAQIRYTPWFDVNAAVRTAAGMVQRRGQGTSATATPATLVPSLDGMPPGLLSLSKLYLSIVNVPDAFWGWQAYAFRASVTRARECGSQIILASGPPFSAFQVAARLARRLQIPWVADFRDFWADKPQYPFLEWRRKLDLLLERRALRNAVGFVTVSQPMVDVLARRYPHLYGDVVMNGFDPNDYPPAGNAPRGLPLVLRYTGTLFYVGNNDPMPLLRALSLLGEDRRFVRLEFLLRDSAPRLSAFTDRAGVRDSVRVFPPVTYQRSLQLQRQSDVLVLILPSGRNWEGAFSGKFFEYCGAGRPILAIAEPSNVAAQAVRQHGLGLASLDAREIAAWLKDRIEEKRSTGNIRGMDPRRVLSFTRKVQTERLASFLTEYVNHTAR